MKIKPTYVTFEQAKKLTEKGMFPLYSESFFDDKGKKHEVSYKQTPDANEYSCFEQHQVVEWLKVVHGIWVYVKLGYGHEYVIQKTGVPYDIIYTDGTFKSPQEAYSAAFDFTLNNLI